MSISKNITHRNNKNNHLWYYLHAWLMTLVPRCVTQAMRKRRLRRFDRLTAEEQKAIRERVDYYCQFTDSIQLPENSIMLRDFRRSNVCSKDRPRYVHNGYVHSVHFYDAYELTRFFPDTCRISIFSGDLSHVISVPCLCKSRPVRSDSSNRNNILLKLNKVRHFVWVHDPYRWEDKECRILFRGNIDNKPRRKAFIDMWQSHPWCDLSDECTMSLSEHLPYRYIMALEGNDVASNLKWVMSSNSIAVMPRPTCETWFMEGRLIPDYHYIEIKPDYTDLIERIEYYEAHPDKAHAIIEHAHEWVKQFQDKEREELVGLMVVDKYMRLTGQL